MNQLLEWSPLIVFFVVFKLFGIYWATAALMLVCIAGDVRASAAHRQIQDHARDHGRGRRWCWARRRCCCTTGASFNGSPRCCSRSPPPPFSAARHRQAAARAAHARGRLQRAAGYLAADLDAHQSRCGSAGSRCSPRRISTWRGTFTESVWVNFKVFGITAAMLCS